MQKNFLTRIKIALVRFRDTYFTGVQRIFRYLQRLEARFDLAQKEFEARFGAMQNELKALLNEAKLNQSLENLSKVLTPTKERKWDTFILFDYSYHIHRNYHNLGDFIQTLATKEALQKCLKTELSNIEFFDRDSLSFYSHGGGFALCRAGLP